MDYFDSKSLCQTVVASCAIKSVSIPFTPLEELAEVRAEASCPDDAEIDLSIWASPQETQEQAEACSVLRRFAVKWWARYHTGKA